MSCCGTNTRIQAMGIIKDLQRKGSVQEADELKQQVSKLDRLMKRAERVLARRTRQSEQ